MISRKNIKEVVTSYSQIFFFKDYRIGLVILLTTLIVNWNVGICGLIALILTFCLQKVFRIDSSFLGEGTAYYNSLLVGFGVGMALQLNASVFLLLFCGSLLSMLLTIVFGKFNIPVLSLPFSITSILIYLATRGYNKLFHLYNYHYFSNERISQFIPEAMTIFFKSIGSIIFIPSVYVGLVIFLLVLLKSRIIATMIVFGLSMGMWFESLFVGSLVHSSNIAYSFNYILCSVAISSIFVVPGLTSILIALVSTALCTLIIDALVLPLSQFGIPVFALPFNIVSILMVVTLRTIKFDKVPVLIKETPEETFDFYNQNIKRFHTDEVLISLPFQGEWTVYQAFDDEWTHTGDWKHAYDFIKTDNENIAFEGKGELEDFYCYGETVLSPVSGHVHSIVMNIEDNNYGKVDLINNWGNHIILLTSTGHYVLLAHLKQSSSLLNIGEWVNEGMAIAQCGNSGYSPQPHLHIQVQESAQLGSKTIPFKFKSYLSEQRMEFAALPKKEARITQVEASKELATNFSFYLSQEFQFLETTDSESRSFTLKVCMDDRSGEFFFLDEEENKLYYYLSHKYFYFYNYEGRLDSSLARIYKSIPRLPMANINNLSWSDQLPVYFFRNRFSRAFYQFLGVFTSIDFFKQGEWKFVNSHEIRGSIDKGKEVFIEIDQNCGFKEIRDEEWKLEKLA